MMDFLLSVYDNDGLFKLAEAFTYFVGKCNTSVLTAGASNGNYQMIFAFTYIARNKVTCKSDYAPRIS